MKSPVLVLVFVLQVCACAESVPTCGAGTRPTIAATTVNEASSREKSKVYQIATFGEDVSLFCSGGTDNMSIESDGDRLSTSKLNATTIQHSITQPCVGQHEYACVDRKASCKDILIVIVVPSFFVRSPRVRHAPSPNRRDKYFVPHGDVYEIICTGKDLKIYGDDNYMRPSEIVNVTTVKIKAKANTTGNFFYLCSSQGCKGVGKINEIQLIVDFYPEAHNFQCISYGLHWRKLECSWMSSSKNNNFHLFLVESNGIRHLLCSYGSGATSRVCRADNSDGSGSLLLQTCNKVFCDDKIYPFETNSIVKLNAPSELQLLNRTSRGATLKWFSRFAWWESEFKVEYRLLASAWHQINTSSLKIRRHSDYCEFQITLPCPDAHYEVRVSVKHRKAMEERFWSEPSPSIFFFTDPSLGELEPACNAAMQEPEPITSVETGLNEVRKLIRQSMKEKQALRTFVSDLQSKLAKIRSLSDL